MLRQPWKKIKLLTSISMLISATKVIVDVVILVSELKALIFVIFNLEFAFDKIQGVFTELFLNFDV